MIGIEAYLADSLLETGASPGVSGLYSGFGFNGHGFQVEPAVGAVVAKLIAAGSLVHVLPEYTQDANVRAVYPQRLAGSGRLRACVEFLEAYFKPEPSGSVPADRRASP